MLPYFQIDGWQLGPITIHAWGLMVALGLAAATLLSLRLAKKYLLSAALTLDLIIWALLGGLTGARVFHVVFYAGDYYWQNPVALLKIWQGGLSSLGGMVGAGLAVAVFVYVRKVSRRELLSYLDILALSLWLGWGVGRLGCFLIHDHPGRLSHFFLAVNFPAGARLDLGLLESLFSFLLFIIYYLLFSRLIKIRWGLVFSYSFISYAAVRFFLDFLRATDLPFSDPRYFYLTPAQWGMAAVVIILTLWCFRGKVRRIE